MSKRINDIQDDDFRIIGAPTVNKSEEKRSNRKPLWIYAVVVGVVCAVPVVFDPMPVQKPESVVEVIKPLGDYSDTTKAYTEHLRDTINDIPIDIYIPHNAVPQLIIGVPDIYDKSIVMTTQAADVRADNGKIVGAFVQKVPEFMIPSMQESFCLYRKNGNKTEVIAYYLIDQTKAYQARQKAMDAVLREVEVEDAVARSTVDLARELAGGKNPTKEKQQEE